MNKLEIGMYVRTKKYGIAKIIGGISNKFNIDVFKKDGCTLRCQKEKDILKASFDIIDLIEEGDILLLFDKEYGKEYKVEVMVDRENFAAVVNYEQNDLLNLEYELITNEHIELLKILTKEQFESMSYRIGE